MLRPACVDADAAAAIGVKPPETAAEGLPVVLDPAHEAIRRAEAGVREGIRLAEKDPARPVCHFRPPARWMNDPNGTLFHDGWYHLFYQLNPFGEQWGDVHWGHARSRDLVRWEHLPVALAPTPEAGEGHCFSGCGWTDAKGRPVFFYTSWPPLEEGPPGGGGRAAQQWIVRADAGLRRFEKPAENPVLEVGRGGVPAFRPDWRDPFVFEERGRTFMLVGAALGDDMTARGPDAEEAAEDGEAVIALLESDDPELGRWSYRGILHRAPRSRVAFFECPSLRRIDGGHVLIYSAHRPAEYLTGGFDPEAGAFHPEGGGRIDHSPHFYAPAFFAREPKGRPILVGWVRGWGEGRGWNGVLSLPRLVGVGDDGRLRQRPLPALQRMRGREVGLAPASRLVRETREVEPLRSGSIEVSAALSLGDGTAGLRLRRADDDAVVATVTLGRAGGPNGALHGPEARVEARIEARTLSFRLQPGEPPAPSSGAAEPSTVAIPLPGVGPGEPVALRLFWDRSVLEVFLADGRETCTLAVDAAGEALRVEAFARGGAGRFETLRAWSLEPIW